MKLAIISDIHEDIVSLNYNLKAIDKYKPDEIICLGDIVGFNQQAFDHLKTRNASECIKMVKSNCKIVVAGNHDYYSIKKIDNELSAFQFPENWYKLDFNERLELSQGKLWLYEDSEMPCELDEEDKHYLSTLPAFEILEANNFKFLFSHTIFPDLIGNLKGFPESIKGLFQHFEFMSIKNCMIGVSGHGHIQGLEIATTTDYYFKKYGKYILGNSVQWMAVPAIVRNCYSCGFIILDSETLEIEVIEKYIHD